MEDFGVFRGKHEIEFATDEKNKMTVIIGPSGSGKTTILNAICRSFGLGEPFGFHNHDFEERQNYENRKSSVEFEGNKISNNIVEVGCHFLDGESLENWFNSDRLKNEVDVDDSFIDEMNELFGKYGGPRQHRLRFARDENSIFYLNNNDTMYNPSAFHKAIMTLIFWLVLKNRLFPESFLILDEPLPKISSDRQIKLFEMIIENTQQLIVLDSTTDYLDLVVSMNPNESHPSLRDFITKQMDVKEYQIIMKEGIASIEPL